MVIDVHEVLAQKQESMQQCLTIHGTLELNS